MRCVCPICASLYEGAAEIAALVCGHTFHYECLNQWFTRSKTCPACRKKVLKKDIIYPLYFDQAEGEDADQEYAKIKNDLDVAQAAIRERELQKAEMVTEKEMAKRKVDELEALKKVLESELREEKTANSGLKRELRSCRSMVTKAEEAIKDAANVRKQLVELSNVQKIVGEHETEIAGLINRYQGDAHAMAVWCVLLRRELATKKSQCRKIQDLCEKTKKESEQRRIALRGLSNENKLLKDHKGNADQDLERVEKENRCLREKLVAVERDSGDKGFCERCLFESPAPAQPKKRPRLSLPEDGLDFDDQPTPSTSSPAHSRPHSAEPSPSSLQKSNCEEYGSRYVRIVDIASAVAKKQKPKATKDVSDNPMVLSGYNLFKKPGAHGTTSSSVFKKGYNGMGSHESFIKPSGRSRPLATATNKAPKIKFGILKPKPMFQLTPPLPSLNDFTEN